MKKLFLGLLSFLLLFGAVHAQSGAKALNQAGNDLRAFNLDQVNNKAKLQEAVTAIDQAEEDASLAGDIKLWQTKGDVYNEVATQITQVRQLGLGSLDDLPKIDNPALEASAAYQKALGMAEKKFQTKDALKGLQAVQSNLYNMGIYAYEDGNFDKAYQDFNEVVNVHKVLKQNGEASTLDDETAYKDQLYVTGLAALNADKVDMAKPLFEELSKANYDKPAIYEALYKINADADREAAYKYLEQGRQKYPDDVSLLFAEINHFLRINKLDELIGKLKTAIEKEPDNVSLYSTLGNVYDNLYQKETEAGNTEKADQYFNDALKYYNTALEKEPEYTDATYSIGALYFNRAANKTKRLNELSNDFSKEGQKKYEVLKVEIEKEFDTALPYFVRVEKKDPNDVNTLIALKEIYARKNDFTTSNEFKARLEKAQAGEKNTSYFMDKQ